MRGTWYPAEKVVERALGQVGQGVYALGAGGRDPEAKSPFVMRRCDCSGFVCWCLGVDRLFSRFHVDWMNTDAMIADVLGPATFFTEINRLSSTILPGDVLVYPGIDLNRDGKRDRIGHCAIVVAVHGTRFQDLEVVQCQARRNPAVIQTDGAAWSGRGVFRGATRERWRARVIRPTAR